MGQTYRTPKLLDDPTDPTSIQQRARNPKRIRDPYRLDVPTSPLLFLQHSTMKVERVGMHYGSQDVRTLACLFTFCSSSRELVRIAVVDDA